MAAIPFNIRDWIKLIVLQVSNGLSAPLPTEPILSFNPPLVAVDDPTNSRTQVYSQGGGVVVATATVGTTTLTTVSGNVIIPIDTTGGGVVVLFPLSAPAGFQVTAIDVGLATSTGSTVIYSGTGGDKVQNPDTMSLAAAQTVTWPQNIVFTKIGSSAHGDFWAIT